MSRKKTASAPMSRLMPMQNTMSSSSATNIQSMWMVGGMRKKSMTMATAMRLKAKLTAAEKTFWTGKTQRSILTFLSSDEAPMMEPRPPLVASLMSMKVMLPTMR